MKGLDMHTNFNRHREMDRDLAAEALADWLRLGSCRILHGILTEDVMFAMVGLPDGYDLFLDAGAQTVFVAPSNCTCTVMALVAPTLEMADRPVAAVIVVPEALDLDPFLNRAGDAPIDLSPRPEGAIPHMIELVTPGRETRGYSTMPDLLMRALDRVWPEETAILRAVGKDWNGTQEDLERVLNASKE